MFRWPLSPTQVMSTSRTWCTRPPTTQILAWPGQSHICRRGVSSVLYGSDGLCFPICEAARPDAKYRDSLLIDKVAFAENGTFFLALLWSWVMDRPGQALCLFFFLVAFTMSPGWASLHLADEHLRGFWEELALHAFLRCFTMFHQVLVGQVALRSPTFRQALASITLLLGSACFTGRSGHYFVKFYSWWFKVQSMVLLSCLLDAPLTGIYPMLPWCAIFPPFLSCAPLLTWLRNGHLVSDCLDRGGFNLFVSLIRCCFNCLAFACNWLMC